MAHPTPQRHPNPTRRLNMAGAPARPYTNICEACNHLAWLARVSDVTQLPIGADAAAIAAGRTELRDTYVESFDDIYQREYPGLVRLAFVLTGRLDVAEECAGRVRGSAPKVASAQRVRPARRLGPAGRAATMHRPAPSPRRRTRALIRLSGERERSAEIVLADQDLLAAIRSLPMRQAQVVALVLLEDRSIDDVADLLGCSTATTRTRLRRGRLALASKLGAPSRHPRRNRCEDTRRPFRRAAR